MMNSRPVTSLYFLYYTEIRLLRCAESLQNADAGAPFQKCKINPQKAALSTVAHIFNLFMYTICLNSTSLSCCYRNNNVLERTHININL